MLKLSKKIALPLIAVLLIGTGVGGYFLFRNFQIPKYFVDKYPELLEYCDTAEDANGLEVSCKALMLDIKPNVSEGTPSLTSLIITKGEELKEYTITEEEAMFAFTNDVLQFKKLKPVIINIQYTRINPIKYAIQGITFEDIPETYIQDIVNRDIEEIMGMDKNSTTILNSFDFCPRPETLPDYVIKKEEYAKYWEENILPESEYLNGYNYNLDDTTIRLLFACDSTKNVGYASVCLTSPRSFSLQNSPSKNDFLYSEKAEMNRIFLKEISVFYDNLYLREIYVNNLKQNDLLWISTNLDSQFVENDVFCAFYKLLETTKKQFGSFRTEDLKNIVDDSLCSVGESLSTDKDGVYLRNYFLENPKLLEIFNRCKNLTLKIKI